MNTTAAVNNSELQDAYSAWAKENNNGQLFSRDWQLICFGADWQAKKDEAVVNSFPLLVEALSELLSAGQEALDYKDGSGKPILQEAIWKYQELLSELKK